MRTSCTRLPEKDETLMTTTTLKLFIYMVSCTKHDSLRIGLNVFFHMLYKILLFPFISLKISFTLTYFTLKSILLYYDCPMLFGLFFNWYQTT